MMLFFLEETTTSSQLASEENDKRSRANQLRLFTVQPSFILQGKNTTSRTTSGNWSAALLGFSSICFSNQMENGYR